MVNHSPKGCIANFPKQENVHEPRLSAPQTPLTRSDRTKRVKDARSEAQKEIEEYRKEQETKFQKFEKEVCAAVRLCTRRWGN